MVKTRGQCDDNKDKNWNITKNNKESQEGLLVATAILEPLSKAKTGQQHVDISLDLKDIKTHLSLYRAALCVWCGFAGFHLHMCTHLHIRETQEVILFPLFVIKKRGIKAIKCYQQNFLCGRAGGTRGPLKSWFSSRLCWPRLTCDTAKLTD